MHDHRTSDRRSPDGSEQKNEISQILHTQKILQIFLEVSKEKIEILQILHTLVSSTVLSAYQFYSIHGKRYELHLPAQLNSQPRDK
jgi:hypothetical protein